MRPANNAHPDAALPAGLVNRQNRAMFLRHESMALGLAALLVSVGLLVAAIPATGVMPDPLSSAPGRQCAHAVHLVVDLKGI